MCATISLGKRRLDKFKCLTLNYLLFCFLFQFQYANFSSDNYKNTGKGSLKLQLINQRSDFSFALFTGGLTNVLSYKLYTLISLFKHTLLTNIFVGTSFFSNYFWQPKLVAVSNKVSFINPNAPVYPRLAQGKTWDEVSLRALYICKCRICIFIFQLCLSFL